MNGLNRLNVYKNALSLSDMAWHIYLALPKALQFDIGSQFLRSIDSIGANIAEGYGRYHYKDKIKFYYNARGSLWEAKHWIFLLQKRELVSQESYQQILNFLETTGKQLNNFIKATGANITHA